MSKFYTIGVIFFTIVNFASILLLYHHYQTSIITRNSAQNGAKPSEKVKPKTVTIATGNGSYVGFIQKFNDKRIKTFLGIPFALPPKDEYRFNEPQPYELNGRTIIADQWPKPCLQPDNHLRLNNYHFSEDCLYLNVWSPALSTTEKTELPVLVIIHTGAFLFGSASEATYNGLALSQLSNTVVVTFNYRLNVLGFYYDPSENVTSNVGMLDQVAALKWIKNNIHFFNGDPNRITLIGQSSAGLSTGMHITSPLSKGLFSQAIIMSGSPLQTESLKSPEQVRKFWINYEKHLDCDGEQRLKSDCLFQKTVNNRNLLLKMENIKNFSDDKLFVNVPIVVDNRFQPKIQKELLNSLEKFTDDFQLLFGYTDDEGSWIASINDRANFGPKVKPNLTASDARKALNSFSEQMKTNKDIDKSELESHYLGTLVNKNPDPEVLNRLVTEALGDHYINCPSNIFARKLYEKNATIYQYYWNYKGDKKTSSFWNAFNHVWCGDWMGTCHSFEMFALFGQPFLEPNNFNDDDRIVSHKFIDLVTYFVYKRKLFWNRFDDDSKPFYIIDSSLTEHKFGQNLKDTECNKIWYDHIL